MNSFKTRRMAETAEEVMIEGLPIQASNGPKDKQTNQQHFRFAKEISKKWISKGKLTDWEMERLASFMFETSPVVALWLFNEVARFPKILHRLRVKELMLVLLRNAEFIPTLDAYTHKEASLQELGYDEPNQPQTPNSLGKNIENISTPQD